MENIFASDMSGDRPLFIWGDFAGDVNILSP